MKHLLMSEAYKVSDLCTNLLSLEKSVQSAEDTLSYYKEQKSQMEQVLAEAGFTLLVNREKPLESMLVERTKEEQAAGSVAVYLPKKDSTR